MSHQLFPPRHAIPGSCLRSLSTGSPLSSILARPPGLPRIYHDTLFLSSPERYHYSLHRVDFRFSKSLQKLLLTVSVEGTRELWLDTGHNPHEYALDTPVDLAQLVLPTGLTSSD